MHKLGEWTVNDEILFTKNYETTCMSAESVSQQMLVLIKAFFSIELTSWGKSRLLVRELVLTFSQL